MGAPRLAAVVFNSTYQYCSEAEMHSAVLRVLGQLYDEITLNPTMVPRRRYDLWSLFPFTSDHSLPLEQLADRAVARICLDSTDQFPGHDVYLTTAQPCRHNGVADRLMQMWSYRWGGELIQPRWQAGPQRPQLPYIHACVDGLPLASTKPRTHVLWNLEHWADERGEHDYAMQVVPILAECDVTHLYLTRTDRGGIPIGLTKLDGIETHALMWPQDEEVYRPLFDGAYAYVVSVPSTGMISVEMALARGIPVVGEATNRWSPWFTPPDRLPLYRTARELYEVQRQVMASRFSDEAARAQFDVARRMAYAMRGQTDA